MKKRHLNSAALLGAAIALALGPVIAAAPAIAQEGQALDDQVVEDLQDFVEDGAVGDDGEFDDFEALGDDDFDDVVGEDDDWDVAGEMDEDADFDPDTFQDGEDFDAAGSVADGTDDTGAAVAEQGEVPLSDDDGGSRARGTGPDQ